MDNDALTERQALLKARRAAIARRLVEARTRAGFDSPNELAKRTGLSYYNVRRWEQAEVEPNGPNLRDYAQATGVTVEWLLALVPPDTSLPPTGTDEA